MERLSTRLKNKRVEFGFSQRELARKIGVTATAISQWERDESNPKGGSLLKLAEIFNVSIEWLGSGKNKEKAERNQHTIVVPYYPDVYAPGSSRTFLQEELKDMIHIPRNIISSSLEDDIFCIKVSGDSMEPTLYPESIIGLDSGKTTIHDGGIYVFSYGRELKIRELRRIGCEKIILKSHNPSYAEEQVDAKDLVVLGKVVWSSNFL